ncbi:transcriptional regulatory protein, MerR family [Thiobacillus denitrificans ATCC 25259]|uniref:Transcriptional regulatory protein, MerR family n=1 Tax=Thiobacillus denitrificans (strain ATCC 25259 / T1) TaxID=292415 RepID=Q3SIZ2_THIDA|nr:chaperone modulator CbpM [Thiobacillus denitrificans]AAZ97383.1 transcriptional regulatory protein, MerR family [Thiobacillus denitrificans ATCC 25259]
MSENEVFVGVLMDDCWLTVEQVAAACVVEPAWLIGHIEAGLFPEAESVAGVWRFSAEALVRARRMRQIERDFDAVPELAALVADVLEEVDSLRARLRGAGLV